MKRDWRPNAVRVEGPLAVGVWYRSPLSEKDHLLGREQEFINEETAWCGLALHYMRDWDDPTYGGLWLTNRASAGCAYCQRRENEYAAK